MVKEKCPMCGVVYDIKYFYSCCKEKDIHHKICQNCRILEQEKRKAKKAEKNKKRRAIKLKKENIFTCKKCGKKRKELNKNGICGSCIALAKSFSSAAKLEREIIKEWHIDNEKKTQEKKCKDSLKHSNMVADFLKKKNNHEMV